MSPLCYYIHRTKETKLMKQIGGNKKMTVTYGQYNCDRYKFFKKHKNDYVCETSPMNEYGVYYKTYSFKDGAQWMERMSPEYVEYEVEVKLVKIKETVKMFKTEYWSTESESKFYYEKF